MLNENKLNDRRIKVLQVADIYNPNESISDQFNQLESKFLDFNSGMLLDKYKNFSLEDYDQVIATKDPNLSSKVPSAQDIAIIKNRENIGKIYILRNNLGGVDKLILPKLHTAISSLLVFKVISVHKFEEFTTPACCCGDLRLHGSLNVIHGCPVSKIIDNILRHNWTAGITLWGILSSFANAS